MQFTKKHVLFCTLCVALLTGCGAKKQETSTPEQMQGTEKEPPSQKPEENQEGELTPQQEDQLKIDEDNVMNPLPG